MHNDISAAGRDRDLILDATDQRRAATKLVIGDVLLRIAARTRYPIRREGDDFVMARVIEIVGDREGRMALLHTRSTATIMPGSITDAKDALARQSIHARQARSMTFQSS